MVHSNTRIAALLFFLLALSVGITAQATQEDGNSIGLVDTEFTCETVSAIKFNPDAYRKLSYNQQRLLEMKWQRCEPRPEREEGVDEDQEQEVIIVNPVATNEDDKVFYGTIKRSQITEARTKCATAGAAAGVVITVNGTVTGNPALAEAGTAIFTYSDVSCASLATELEKGNLLAILGPTQIIANAVANKFTQDTIDNIPVVSDADKENLKKLTANLLSAPSVNVSGSNVTVSAGGASVSVRKPKVVIGAPKAPKVPTPKIPLPKIRRCVKLWGKKVCR